MIKDQVYNISITYDKMFEIVKGYKELKSRVLQLEYEIAESKPFVTDNEFIDSMAFNNSLIGVISEKNTGTDHIALSYAEKAEMINQSHKKALEDELCVLKREKARLEYYISILDSKQSKVLQTLYIDGKTINETTEEMDISLTALKTARKAGIQKLSAMYNILCEKGLLTNFELKLCYPKS